MNCTVSVIMCVHNCEAYIAAAIDSVLRQSYSDIELIIIDDASTDNTVQQILCYDDSRINLIQNKENKGPGASRNIGIEIAHGQWAAFIDADDQWHENRLRELVRVAISHENCFVADDLMTCFSNENGELVQWKRELKRRGVKGSKHIIKVEAAEYAAKNLGVIKPLFPMSYVNKNNIRHIENVFHGEDFEFRMKLFRYGLDLYILNEPLYFYRVTSSALSADPDKWKDELVVMQHILDDEGYSFEVHEAIRKKKKDILRYAPFASAMKKRNYIQAVKILTCYPDILVKALFSIGGWMSRRLFTISNNVSFR